LRASSGVASVPLPRLLALPASGAAGGDSPMAAVGLVEAFATAGLLGAEAGLFETVVAALQRITKVLDMERSVVAATTTTASSIAGAGGLGGVAGGSVPAVLSEQPSLIAVWKPPGWTATVQGVPGLGRRKSSDEEEAEGLTAEPSRGSGRPLQGWLAQQLGGSFPIVLDASVQHGLLHRLDRDTSGVICCAKTYHGYYLGLLQFVARRVRKYYVCLCRGHVTPAHRFLEAPLRTTTAVGGVGSRSSAVVLKSEVSPRGRPARTELLAVAQLVGPAGERCSLVEIRLHTGRMHQIRVHLSNEGHSLIGDTLYSDGLACTWCPRLFLHAHCLEIDIGDGPLRTTTPIPADLRAALRAVTAADEASVKRLAAWAGGAAPEGREVDQSGQ